MRWIDIEKRHELYMDNINTSDRIDEHPPVLVMAKSATPEEDGEDCWFYVSEFLGVESMYIRADNLDEAKYEFATMVKNRLEDEIDWRQNAVKEIEEFLWRD